MWSHDFARPKFVSHHHQYLMKSFRTPCSDKPARLTSKTPNLKLELQASRNCYLSIRCEIRDFGICFDNRDSLGGEKSERIRMGPE
ncbi:hypothetical protein PM082_006389 [Marasmius tenuissimus]|nr:hypothetical protein PM082_006389 [Marasmius tenuissimus]